MLLLVRPHRERNLTFYIETMEELMPSFFAFDHYIITAGLAEMPKCNHEEADTRIIVHILHAIEADLGKSVLLFWARRYRHCHYSDNKVLPSEINPVRPGPKGGIWNRMQLFLYLCQHNLCRYRKSTVRVRDRVSCHDWL